jgi:CYTH domain-containing protein
MSLEIERRFLVDKSKLPDLSSCERFDITQGYYQTAPDEGIVRVRISNESAFITTKFKLDAGINKEFEYEIPYDDAISILSELSLKISKTRFKFPLYYTDQDIRLMWEVDFYNNGLCIAEIELPSIDHRIVIPEWVGFEITNTKGVSNFDMAKSMDGVMRKIYG